MTKKIERELTKTVIIPDDDLIASGYTNELGMVKLFGGLKYRLISINDNRAIQSIVETWELIK